MSVSMVNDMERTALKDFIHKNWTGQGEIIEIGTFVGGSAIFIMHGMKKTCHKARLHIYDTFLFPTNELEQIFRNMVPQCKGQGFREMFDRQTTEWVDWLDVNEGDAAQAKWDGKPIFFMHIDCSISLEFHRSVACEFYPHIIEGGVIAHQDHDYGRAPFIAQMMVQLAPWFEPFMHVSTTVYFRCLKSPARNDLEAVFYAADRLAA